MIVYTPLVQDTHTLSINPEGVASLLTVEMEYLPGTVVVSNATMAPPYASEQPTALSEHYVTGQKVSVLSLAKNMVAASPTG